MPNTAWDEVSMGAGQVGQSMQGLIMGLARQKMMEAQFVAQQKQMQHEQLMQEREYQAKSKINDRHAALYDAQARLHDAETKKLEREDSALKGMGAASRDYVQSLGFGLPGVDARTNPMVSEALARYVESANQAPYTYTHDQPERMAQMLEMGNPYTRMVMAAGGADKLYNQINAGETGFPIDPSLPVLKGGVNVGRGVTRLGPSIGDALPTVQGRGMEIPSANANVGNNRMRQLNNTLKMLQDPITGEPPEAGTPRFQLYQQTMTELLDMTKGVESGTRVAPADFGNVPTQDPSTMFKVGGVPQEAQPDPHDQKQALAAQMQPVVEQYLEMLMGGGQQPAMQTTDSPPGRHKGNFINYPKPELPLVAPGAPPPPGQLEIAVPQIADQFLQMLQGGGQGGEMQGTDIPPRAVSSPMIPTDERPKRKQYVTPKSQEEFQALPVGALFINPADGKLMRKK